MSSDDVEYNEADPGEMGVGPRCCVLLRESD